MQVEHQQGMRLLCLLFNPQSFIMGSNCTPCTSLTQKHRHQGTEIEKYPEDIADFSSYDQAALPQLKFDASLSNIKIVNPPKFALSLKFYISDTIELFLPKKLRNADTNQIKWKSKQNFCLLLNAYDLRQKFLHVEVSEEKGKIISHLKMNVYRIATGPYHHDFHLDGVNKSCSRLNFDLKISQYIETSVECEETEISLKNKYPGETFHLSIRVLKQEKQAPFESTPSYEITLPVDSPQVQAMLPHQFDECPSPLKARGRNLGKAARLNSKITWSSNLNPEMPNFKIFFKSHQLKKSLIHVVIWKGKKPEKNEKEESEMLHRSEKEVDYQMLCDSFMPVSRLFDKDPSEGTDSSKDCAKQMRHLKISDEKLWNNGEMLGQLSMKLKAENNKFISQMNACARTEDGIISMVPLVQNYGLKKVGNMKISVYEESIRKIEEKNMEINQNHSLSYFQVRKIREEMVMEFESILKGLEESLENSYGILTNEEERLKNIEDQKAFISILSKVSFYLQEDENLAEVCWKIILCIIKRGQFNLSNIGFSKEEQDQMEVKLTSFHKKKLRIGVDYQEILFKLFYCSLRLGYLEGRDNPKHVIEMMKAFCYFRIPMYRDLLLKMVVRKEDESVEWKMENIECEQNLPETQNALVFQLDWQSYFYKPLHTFQTKSRVLNKELEENLQGNLWLNQIGKRSSTFHYFLYFLIKRLSELGKKIKFIKWQYFPGYNKLIRSFLFEMKKLKIVSYPKSLIQTSVNLLANEKLINILMTITFEKTHSWDPSEVMKSLELIGRYLGALTKEKKLLPPTFNYLYFFKALKIVFEGEFSVAIVKALVIIYNNYESFNIEFRKNITLYLMGKVFFRLFMHWSNSVRSTFYHILILKIGRSGDVFNHESRKEFGDNHQIMNQIEARYRKVITCIDKAAEKRNREMKKELFKQMDKELYKTMRRKLKKKRGGEINLERHMKHDLTHKKVDSPQKISKYSTVELTSNENSLERSYSVTISSNVIEELSFWKAKGKGKEGERKEGNKKEGKKEEEEEMIRTKSGIAYMETESSESKNWMDTNKTKNTSSRKRRLSVYGNDDFELKEYIEKEEIDYILVAHKEFEALDKEVREYFQENEELPVCELDVEIAIDEKEIKPDNIDNIRGEGLIE